MALFVATRFCQKNQPEIVVLINRHEGHEGMNKQKPTKGIISLLLSFGLTWHATILLFVFIMLFNIFSVVFVYMSETKSLMVWVSSLIPLIVINLILGVAVLNPTLKKHLLEEEKSFFEKNPKKSIGRKAYLSFACYGTFVALTIVFFVLIIAFNLIDYMDYIVPVWLFVGGPVICKLLWDFYTNRLR